MKKKKGLSVKARIIAFTVIPSVALIVAMLITGISFMKTGMEDEVLKGLLSSAYTYKDIACHEVQREAGDNDIETTLKNETGYDFTWFDGDTRKNSSLKYLNKGRGHYINCNPDKPPFT